ncbi:MAG: iron complex outerrane recepter protein [Sphingomonadales bacterium]|nr:iron complex outerrane recepter protein [Sphingomonadales bacterium]
MTGRGACAVAALLAAQPAAALAETGNEPPIVVTGARGETIEQAPGSEEGLDAARIRESVNIVSVEDSLRYLPSLLVRKRHIGDTQAPLATRTSGVGASARSLVYVDGVLVSALIGNNNSFAAPRWGIVSPEEIARVDVLYGPFAAAYPGNSIGAVVNIATRLPNGPTAAALVQGQRQRFRQYGTDDGFSAWRAAASWGGREGPLAWFLSANHVAGRGQPLAYAIVARPAGAGAAGTPVTGAFADVNRTGAPIFVIGASGIEEQRQDNLGLRLAFDLGPRLRLSYRGALFLNDTEAGAETYLRDGSGSPVFAGALNIEGRPAGVPAGAFSNNVYLQDQRHSLHALTLEGRGGRLDWRAIATRYGYGHDVQRIPSGALPAAAAGGAGSIVRMDGTGWTTLDLLARRRGEGGGHDLSFGAHGDRFALSNNRFATADWRGGGEGALVQAARGRTRTLALWAQDRWTLAPRWSLTLGGRYEWWRAWSGFNFSAAPALSAAPPERRQQGFSPKASLAWEAGGWSATLSAAQAWRFPTVSELYQAIATGPTITVPDPDLRAERARSAELAIGRGFTRGRVRLSLFEERIADALISQSAPLVPGQTTLFNYVQNVPRVRTRGLELVAEGRDLLLDGLDLAGSVTLADPEVLSDPAFPAAEGRMLPQVPRRRATLVLTYRPSAAASVTVAGRYASRSFATIDNSDTVGHTFQGFEGYLVIDARATWRLGRHVEAAIGVENLTDDRYFLFHPFPQRSLTAEIGFRW